MSIELKEGMVLGDTYRLVQLVGRGGMGEVWRTEHTRLPRAFAVKVLHGAAAANETALARFRREAEIASRLGHPNIVQVLDFNTLDDGTPYMVMELLEGESLRERARRGPIPLHDVVRLLRQVASALREAHRQGVIHRDLKPDNIFICEEELDGGRYERVKVLDFGISKIQGSQTIVTRDAEVLGTPIYMAPEQAAGQHALVDGRTDEFALAAIAYELLSGQIAFGGETLIEVVNKIMNGAPAPLHTAVPALPDHAVQAIDRALAKQPDGRFPQITDFIEALAGGMAVDAITEPDPHVPMHEPGRSSQPGGAAFAATAASQDNLPPANALNATLPTPYALATPRQSAATSGASASRQHTGPPSVAPYGANSAFSTGGMAADEPAGAGRGKRVVLIGLVVGGLVTLGAVIATQLRDRARTDNRAVASAPQPRVEDRRYQAQPSVERSTTTRGSDRKASTSSASSSKATGATSAPAEHAAASAVRDTTADGTAPPAAPAAGQTGSVVPTNAAPPSPGHRKQSKTSSSTNRSHQVAADLPAEVLAELQQAELALQRGDTAEALHHARRSLDRHKTPQAFLVMVSAYCLRRDLRMSKAMLRQLSGGTRRRAIRWCRKHGFDVTP